MDDSAISSVVAGSWLRQAVDACDDVRTACAFREGPFADAERPRSTEPLGIEDADALRSPLKSPVLERARRGPAFGFDKRSIDALDMAEARAGGASEVVLRDGDADTANVCLDGGALGRDASE